LSQPTADVVIGNVNPGAVSSGFANSLLHTIGFDRHNGGRIAGWNFVGCSANVSAGRNALVEWFLDSPAEWLVQIDSDMMWRPDAIHRLLEVADPVERPVVGGLCFAQEADTLIIWPTMFDVTGTEDSVEFVRYDEWPDGVVMPVGSTGAAFLLTHRSVMEKIRDREFSAAYPWFQEREIGGKRSGEDVTFCLRAAAVGVKVHVHTGVAIGHIKPHVVTLEGYQAQRQMLAQKEYLEAAYPEEYAK
jgi:hypothetical protein